jgi:lactate dehydrogenase-like 2-hydroxyacid dehydrogenase
METGDPTKPLVVFGVAFRQQIVERIGRFYRLILPDTPEGFTPTNLPPVAREARAMMTRGGAATTAALMDAMPKLGLIACYGTGYDGLDIAAADARKIAVSFSPGGNAASVADLAMAHVLASARRIVFADRYIRDGHWRVHPPEGIPVMPGLSGRRLGIIGLGLIGTKIAARGAAFEMEIGYTGRAPHGDLAYTYHPSLLGLAEWSDILVVATRLTPETRHSIDAAVLKALGPKGHVVNIARGPIIHQTALIAALKDGTIAGAGLDVFEIEPGAPEELRALPNVVLTPHIGGSTESAQDASQSLVLANLDAFFAGRPVLNPIPR